MLNSMSSELTFLVTTDGPQLGVAQTKQVRGHVTKRNFAERRRKQAIKCTKAAIQTINDQETCFFPTSGLDPLSPNIPTDGYWCVTHLLDNYRPIIFPAGDVPQRSAKETQWVYRLLSEPALAHACMYISLKYGPSPSGELARRHSQSQADWHCYRAIRIINERLNAAPDPSAATDGLLGAVFTLAYAQQLAGDYEAWKVHKDGLDRMIQLRRSHGNNRLPQWLINVQLQQAGGYACSAMESTRKASKTPIVTAAEQAQILQCITRIAMGVSELLPQLQHLEGASLLDGVNSDDTQGCHITRSKANKITELSCDARSLVDGQSNRATSVGEALLLFIHLTFPTAETLSPVALEDHVTALMESLQAPDFRLCSATALDLWLAFVGAAACEPHTSTRDWFIAKVSFLIQDPLHQDWEALSVTLCLFFELSASLKERFRLAYFEALGQENGSSEQIGEHYGSDSDMSRGSDTIYTNLVLL